MKVLFLIVNLTCDLACRYCFYSVGHEKRSADRIKPKQIARFTQAIKANGFTTVVLTGGDPFCSQWKQETFALIESLKSAELKVVVNTSGVKLDEADLGQIIEFGIDRIDISIDSVQEKLHNAERGRYQDTVFTLQGLLRRGHTNVATTTVITERNAQYAAETLRWLQSMGVVNTRYQPAFTKTVQDYACISEALEDCAKVYSHAYTDKYIEQCKRANCDLSPAPESECRMGLEYFVCDCRGNLMPCFHREDIVLGNILVDAPEKIAQAVEECPLCRQERPLCFGKHCVSLYDNPLFWKERA